MSVSPTSNLLTPERGSSLLLQMRVLAPYMVSTNAMVGRVGCNHLVGVEVPAPFLAFSDSLRGVLGSVIIS